MTAPEPARWPRPVPAIGDPTSAAERRADPRGWAMSAEERDAIAAVLRARRDVRRFRPDPLPDDLLERLLEAAHTAPSVGHSQPWRFVVVRDPATRQRAAWLADAARVAQAAEMEPERARQLLDLQLEGIREAPVGVVVCCDRRGDPRGVLGRATFHDADLWSCACAIQNLWLTARAEGLGVGWVTLFRPHDLRELIGAPEGVETLGWLCIGWPDERQPLPGLERAGWSARQPLADVVLHERWTAAPVAAPPPSYVRSPAAAEVVGARDIADELLAVPRALGVLDAALDRVVARRGSGPAAPVLVLAVGDHPVADLGVTPYSRAVTADLLDAARAGRSIGATAARAAGLRVVVVDAGTSDGDLLAADALAPARVADLVEQGRSDGARLGAGEIVALGEIGIGNTTVAAALVAVLLGLAPNAAVGLGSGADAAMLARKREVVAAAQRRVQHPADPLAALAAVGGPEAAYLCGVTVGVAEAGGVVVLDGLLTSVAALCAVRLEPGVSASLVAGQRSRERAHAAVLAALGVEPLLDLRLRAGEGVGAVLATRLLVDGLVVRRATGRTGRS